MGQRLKVAYLHYHLKPSGVTTVIQHQASAVEGRCRTLLVACRPPQDLQTVPFQAAPLIAYDRETHQPFTAQELATQVETAIKRQWPSGCDVLHVHNPTLAKNKLLPKALEILRNRGMCMFLQIHDFAEDGRPDAYPGEAGYTRDVHYGVINSRDYEILIKAGLTSEGLHLIPNKIHPFHSSHNSHSHNSHSHNSHIIIYPVRAIRRKNIGEVFLLSLFLKDSQRVGITLPPNSPNDQTAYLRWKEFLQQHPFNVRLEVGLHNDFRQLIADAPFMITTSINEGFGFTFMEPWTAGKMVLGRYLPHVCRDFQQSGVKLEHLYQRLNIPLDMIDGNTVEKTFYQRWRDTFLHHAGSFGLQPEPSIVEDAYQTMTKDKTIDFGVLDESAQMRVLLNLFGNQKNKEEIFYLNPGLQSLNTPPDPALIAHNDQVVRRAYGNEIYRDRLIAIYETVAGRQVRQCIDSRSILESFLKPERFKMLQWKER